MGKSCNENQIAVMMVTKMTRMDAQLNVNRNLTEFALEVVQIIPIPVRIPRNQKFILMY